jgi:antitoxin component YwqK of YwqJK toxin-antitoxin module
MGIFDFLKSNKNIENDNGLNEIYYDDGKGTIKERFYKKNGKRDGLCQHFYKNGQIEMEEIWKNGELKSKTCWDYYGTKPYELHEFVNDETGEIVTVGIYDEEIKRGKEYGPVQGNLIYPGYKLPKETGKQLKNGLEKILNKEIRCDITLKYQTGEKYLTGKIIEDRFLLIKTYLLTGELKDENKYSLDESYFESYMTERHTGNFNDQWETHYSGISLVEKILKDHTYEFKGILYASYDFGRDKITKEEKQEIEKNVAEYKEQLKRRKKCDEDSELRILISELSGDFKSKSYNGSPYNGIGYELHDNGALSIEGEYKNGTQEGIWKTYYDNGQLNIKGRYIDGKMTGEFEFYYKDGVLSRKTNYKDGKEDGLNIQWHYNGEKEYEQFWEKGKLQSEKRWDESGDIIE